MSGEWAGWQNWQRFLEAGIVENAVDFSEEAIIVDHAVGRTKNAIGKCWPMDAAVAYTLMKAGPDKSMNWADMVNTHTRGAAVMMSGKVGYGEVPTPSIKSCGHDEVNAYSLTLGEPMSQGEVLYFKTNWGSSNLEAWLKENTEELKKAGHNVTELLDTYGEIRVGVKHQQISISAIMLCQDIFFDPLMAALKTIYPTATDFSTDCNTDVVKSKTLTYGACTWGTDDDKVCRHHDRPTSRIWSMIRKDDGFLVAWVRSPCGSGSNNQQWDYQPTNIVPKNVVSWDEARRGMSEKIPEDEVIKYIRESLARMLKRNDNIVSKEGRGKNSQHRWSDWGWLAEMSSYVKNTSSKNRKEGDTENGWKYCKVRSRKSFGHEIADFVWTPIEEIKDYIAGRKEPSDWSASSVMGTMRFSTKQQCVDFMEAVTQAHLDNGGHYSNRTHDGLEKSDNAEWSIRSVTHTVVMHGRIDPDDYLTPQAVIAMWRQGAPAVLKEHRENFEKRPAYTVNQAPPPKEGPSDGDQ